MGLEALLRRLPLPIAQLLRRTATAKSATERHSNAYYLVEAALRLAASARIGLWMERCLEPGSPVSRTLEALSLPASGHWIAFLRELDNQLANRSDIALLPLGDVCGQLEQQRDDWPAVGKLAQHAIDSGLVLAKDGEQATNGLLGFFEFALAYHQGFVGARAVQDQQFFQRMGLLWVGAVTEVMGDHGILGGLRLAYLKTDPVTAGPNHTWLDLTGMAGFPMDNPPNGDVPLSDGSLPRPGEVYLVGPGTLIPLHPLVVYVENELGQESFGFLSRTNRRVRKGEGQEVEIVRSVGYLDFTTGATLAELDPQSAINHFLCRLRGTQLNADEFLAIQNASAAEYQDEPTEAVSSGVTVGDFELLEEVGRGAMGIVYRARQRSIGRIVALKVLPPSIAADEVTTKRFQREVAALARVDHPNVVKVFTYGLDRDRHYFAMEYVDGANLTVVGRVLADLRSTGTTLHSGHLAAAASRSSYGTKRRVPAKAEGEDAEQATVYLASGDETSLPRLTRGDNYWSHLAELFAGAAMGVHQLHEQGVIHRDIKPGNLMLTVDAERLVVMDLGLAKTLDESRALTREDVKVLGTLRYMPPEQLAQGASAAPTADVYGLGATLFELVTSEPFLEGDTESQVIQRLLTDVPRTARQAAPEVPKDLDTIITVATARNPNHRYQSAAAMAEDLLAFSRGRPVVASPPGPLTKLYRRLRRSPATLTAIALITVLMVAGGIYRWRITATTHTYCVGVGFAWSAPTCIGELPEELQRRREFCYRFSTRAGLVRKVERVNGYGLPESDMDNVQARDEDDRDRYSVWQYIYNDRDKVVTRKLFDYRGHLQQVELFDNQQRRIRLVDAQGAPIKLPESQASVLVRTYDEQGRTVEERYENVLGYPRPNRQGVLGYHYEYREDGLVKRQSGIDADGKRMATQSGVGHWAYEYTAQGDMVRRSLFDSAGVPVLGPEGYAELRLVPDKGGNYISASYHGVDGEPVLNDGLCASIEWKFDDRGNDTLSRCLGLDGKLSLSKDGWAEHHLTYDEVGNQVMSRAYGVDGELTTTISGVAQWRRSFDARRNLIELEGLSPDGRPALFMPGGFSKVVYTHTKRGFLRSSAYFGTDGKATLNEEGIAKEEFVYDRRGKMTRVSYYGASGEAVAFKVNGCAQNTWKYNEFGMTTELQCLDGDGNRIESSNDWAMIRWYYDGNGRLTAERLLGVDGQLTLNEAGYAIMRAEYDERGNRSKRKYFGTDGTPVLDATGVAEIRYDYDEQGKLVRESYFGTDQHPTIDKNGVSIEETAYDERGNVIRVAYFGLGKKPVATESGCMAFRYHYDKFGRQHSEECQGPNGQLIARKSGGAIKRNEFDARGRVVKTSLYDSDGDLTLGAEGYAIVRHQYDERGKDIEIRYFDVNDRLLMLKEGYAVWQRAYDPRGRVIREMLLDLDSKPARQTERGFPGMSFVYDARGNLVEKTSLGVDGKPVNRPSGFATERYRFDQRGNQIEDAIFDAAGEPVLVDDRCPVFQSEYDARGNKIKVRCLDVDRSPLTRGGGFAGLAMEYDGVGNVTRRVYLGEDGRTTIGAMGYAGERLSYDGRRNVVALAFFGTTREPILHPNGYAEVRWEFDVHDRKVAEMYFGLDGTPIGDRSGTARQQWDYDERGNIVRERFFDTQGRPYLHPVKGYAVRHQRFDPHGRRVFVGYKDSAGSLVGAAEGGYAYAQWEYGSEDKEGYAMHERLYNSDARLVAESFRGADGQPVHSAEKGYAVLEVVFSNDGTLAGAAAYTVNEAGDGELYRKYFTEFNEQGLPERTRFFGPGGELVVDPGAGYAEARSEYDAQGNKTGREIFGIEGQPIVGAEGYASFRKVYDEQGKLITTTYYGADGRRIHIADPR